MNIKCFLIEDTGKTTDWEDVVVNGKVLGRSKTRIYKRLDTGEEILFEHGKLPVGAIWRSECLEEHGKPYTGIDGKSYTVMTPGGEWNIDSIASNCTKVGDVEHKCWCRHGEAPNFTVNKEGNTCSAGAGSIQIREYHGFLINGELTNC